MKECSETIKLAEVLSKLVQIDTAIFKFKEPFSELKDEKKWHNLNHELHIYKVYLKEEELKSMM